MIPFLGRRPGIRPSAHPEQARSDAALRSASPEGRRFGWDDALVWMMRLLALLWLAKGLYFWAVILGAGEGIPPFETRSLGFQSMVVFFAVVNPVVAVGLWMAASWGGVLWLLAVMSFLILSSIFPTGLMPGPIPLLASIALIAIYLALSFLAASRQGGR